MRGEAQFARDVEILQFAPDGVKSVAQSPFPGGQRFETSPRLRYLWLLFADSYGCGNFLPMLIHGNARARRLAVLPRHESLGRHAVSTEDAHHRFDLLLSGETQFFHP